jgi:hypothetical protein
MLEVVMWWALIQRILNKSLRYKKHKYKHAYIHGQTYIQHTNTQTHPHNHKKPHKVTTEQKLFKHTICMLSPTVNKNKDYWARAKVGCVVHVMGALHIWSFHVYICCTTVLVSPFLMYIPVICFSGLLHVSWTQCWPVSRFRTATGNVMFVAQQYQIWGSNCNTQYHWKHWLDNVSWTAEWYMRVFPKLISVQIICFLIAWNTQTRKRHTLEIRYDIRS